MWEPWEPDMSTLAEDRGTRESWVRSSVEHLVRSLVTILQWFPEKSFEGEDFYHIYGDGRCWQVAVLTHVITPVIRHRHLYPGEMQHRGPIRGLEDPEWPIRSQADLTTLGTLNTWHHCYHAERDHGNLLLQGINHHLLLIFSIRSLFSLNIWTHPA